MYLVLFGRVDDDLAYGEESGQQCMVCKEYIIEVDLASLVRADPIAIAAINRVEEEPSQVHRHKIKVHPLNTMFISIRTSCA